MNLQCHSRVKKLQFLIHWEGYSSMHDSWKDVADVHTPEKLEEYYQHKRTAIRTLKYKDDTSCLTISTLSPPNSSFTPLLSLDTKIPLQISATCLMQHNEQPVDSIATLLTSVEVSQGQLTLYCHDNIWPYMGATFALDKCTNDHK
jgi:hypothetical protein